MVKKDWGWLCKIVDSLIHKRFSGAKLLVVDKILKNTLACSRIWYHASTRQFIDGRCTERFEEYPLSMHDVVFRRSVAALLKEQVIFRRSNSKSSKSYTLNLDYFGKDLYYRYPTTHRWHVLLEHVWVVFTNSLERSNIMPTSFTGESFMPTVKDITEQLNQNGGITAVTKKAREKKASKKFESWSTKKFIKRLSDRCEENRIIFAMTFDHTQRDKERACVKRLIQLLQDEAVDVGVFINNIAARWFYIAVWLHKVHKKTIVNYRGLPFMTLYLNRELVLKYFEDKEFADAWEGNGSAGSGRFRTFKSLVGPDKPKKRARRVGVESDQ